MDEKDKDVRWFLKTFPFVGVLATSVIGYVTFRALIEKSIKFEQRRYSRTPDYITLAERPADYMIVMALLVVLLIASTGYCAFRIRKRHILRREDSMK